MDDLPQAIAESSIVIGDMTLRCAVLDDGTRVFNCDDFHEFLRRLEAGWNLTPETLDALADFVTGRS